MAPTFTAEQEVNTTIAVADADMADLLDPVFEGSLARATRFVVIGRSIGFERRAGPADRHLPLTANLVDQLALPAQAS
jgi:hypothetical protein